MSSAAVVIGALRAIERTLMCRTDEQNAVDLYVYSRHTNYVRGYIVFVVPSFRSFMHLLVHLFVHKSTLRQSFAFNLYFKNAHISVTVYQIFFISGS